MYIQLNMYAHTLEHILPDIPHIRGEKLCVHAFHICCNIENRKISHDRAGSRRQLIASFACNKPKMENVYRVIFVWNLFEAKVEVYKLLIFYLITGCYRLSWASYISWFLKIEANFHFHLFFIVVFLCIFLNFYEKFMKFIIVLPFLPHMRDVCNATKN